MPDSKYPSELDTDRELPRVDDDITEAGGDAINGCRSAIFNLEEALGIDPQGAAADVATRLNQSLAADGSIKASALTTIGLIALPITNAMIANTAGIEESKLDLDYNTSQLKAWIDGNRVRIVSLESQLATDINNLTQHVAHPSTYGRHYTSDIDGYIAPYDSYDLQGIITDIKGRIDNHIADPIDAHDASAISVDNSDFLFITATNGQSAFEQLDELGLRALVQHQDRQHSNGILRSQETFEAGTDHNITLVGPATATVASGSKMVTFSASQANMPLVNRGDVLEITISSTTYRFYVDDVISNTVVYVFTDFLVSGSGLATIYRTPEENSATANLALGVKKAATTGEVVQLVHPNAPYFVSSGLDARGLSTGVAENIKIGWSGGNTGDIDVLAAMTSFSPFPSTWSAENVVRVLNDTFRTNAFPLIAFYHKGEVGIAFDEPTGFLSLMTPSSLSAWSVLGFNEGDTFYALENRKFYIDGYEYSGVTQLVSVSATITSGSDIIVASQNLSDLGINANGIVRVKNSTSDDGSYVFRQLIGTNLRVSESTFSNNESVTIEIYGDAFGPEVTPTERTLYELFVDGYNYESVSLKGAARVAYTNTPGGSGDDPESWFDIISVSRTFTTTATKRIKYENREVTLGTRVAGPSIGNEGVAVTIPSADSQGFRFKLYDNNGVDYIEIEISEDPATPNLNYIDVEIFDRTSEERYVQVGTVLHNTTRLKHLDDTRLFGTVGRADVRDDYTRDNITYPRSLLRGGGVIRGMETSGVGTGTLIVGGGEVLANGMLAVINGGSITIPEDGNPLTYNLFVDEEGALQFLNDGEYITNVITTPTVEEIIASTDRTIIAQVDVSGANLITAIRDLRRFVNNLDNRVDLIVEENTMTHGSFASLHAAVNYINASGDLPVQKTIKIRGEIIMDMSSVSGITLPNGIILEGDGNSYGVSYGSKIIVNNNTTGAAVVVPGQNCIIRDLAFEAVNGNTNLASGFVGSYTGDFENLRINNCSFTFPNQATNFYAISAETLYTCYIQDCIFENCGRGINVNDSAANLYVKDNLFEDPYNYAIRLDTAVVNAEISGNYIRSITCDSTAYMISLEDGVYRVNVENNIISATTNAGVVSASKRMINVAEAGQFININNNTLVNTSVANQGFGRGISVTGASDESDIMNLNITENQLQYFKNSVSCGIYISNASRIAISDNNLRFCNRAIQLFTTTDSAQLTGNIINVEAEVSLNNIVHFVGVTNSIISNNVFRVENGTTDKSVIYLQGSAGISITGNTINALFVTFSVVGQPPIFIDSGSSVCLIQSNILICSTIAIAIADGNCIINDGTANVEKDNKGQIYTAELGVSKAVKGDKWFEGMAGGFAAAPVYYGDGGLTPSEDDYMTFEFSFESVPNGAKIIQAEILYEIVAGAVTDLKFRWYLRPGGGTSDPSFTTALGSELNADVVGSIDTKLLEPPDPTYMFSNNLYMIRINLNGQTGQKIIYGAKITYKL